jgi:hypothetical protein
MTEKGGKKQIRHGSKTPVTLVSLPLTMNTPARVRNDEHSPLSTAHQVAAISDAVKNVTLYNPSERETLHGVLLRLRSNDTLDEIVSDASCSSTERDLLTRIFTERVSTMNDMYDKCETDISATERGHVLMEDDYEISLATLEERAAVLAEAMSYLSYDIKRVASSSAKKT